MSQSLPVCPLLSTRGDVNELCLAEHCAWFIAPVKKCALYVMGHQGALEIQKLQKPSS